jgi:Fe-S cluster biogenesis protein NfuA
MSSGSDFERDRVERIIDDEIRPLLRVHGGDLLLISTDDGNVELEFQGACRACALKIVTYAIGVRERLIHLAGVNSVRVRGVNLSDAALERVSGAYADFPKLLSAEQFESADLTLHPPIADPDKIVCLGPNYRDHSLEVGFQQPEYPTLFARFSSSLVAVDDPIVCPDVSDQLDYEGELVAIVGKAGRAWADGPIRGRFDVLGFWDRPASCSAALVVAISDISFLSIYSALPDPLG